MFDPISASIITGLIVGLGSGIIIALLKRKWEIQDLQTTAKKEEIERFENRIKNMEETAERIQKGVWRLNKTVLIIAKIIDDQTSKVHAELSSSLEDIASELLKEPDKG